MFGPTGALVGYTDLGAMELHLEAFQCSFEEGHTAGRTLANSMLVLLVRGLLSQLQFPYAQFPCTALSGHQLYELFWDAVAQLEGCGFVVLALMCNGLATQPRRPLTCPQGCQSLCQRWQIPVLFFRPTSTRQNRQKCVG